MVRVTTCELWGGLFPAWTTTLRTVFTIVLLEYVLTLYPSYHPQEKYLPKEVGWRTSSHYGDACPYLICECLVCIDLTIDGTKSMHYLYHDGKNRKEFITFFMLSFYNSILSNIAIDQGNQASPTLPPGWSPSGGCYGGFSWVDQFCSLCFTRFFPIIPRGI